MNDKALIVNPPQDVLLMPQSPESGGGLFTVQQIVEWFETKEFSRYSKASGHCFRSATRDLLERFGDSPAAEFGVFKLRVVREAMIKRGWTRRFINQSVSRLRLMFKFTASWEMIPPGVPQALETLGYLKLGESSAPEGKKRSAVSDADLQATRALLSPMNRDVFDLLLLTGARPGEILGLTRGVIDRTGDVWRVDLANHKTSNKGKSRFLLFNAQAQAILQRYFTEDPQALFFGRRRDNFGHAVKKASIKAGVSPFSPHWLRHTVATRLVEEVGLEAAQQLLGHSTAAMTHHYSRSATRLAMKAIGAVQGVTPDVPSPVVPLGDKLAWSMQDVVALTSLTEGTVRQMTKRGDIVCLRIQGLLLYDPASVRAYFETKSEEVRQQIIKPERVRKTIPKVRRPWTPEEDSLLSRYSVREVAEKTGRGFMAVQFRRKWLKMIGAIK